MTAISPLAPSALPDLPEIDGVRFATGASGLKYKGRDDVMLARLAPGTEVAGVFTRSATRSAPVLDCQAKIGSPANGQPAAIIVNAGNANAFTGKNGTAATNAVTAAVTAATGAPQSRVFSSSTGVIGEPLDHGRITALLGQMNGALRGDAMAAAAAAIKTTDTFDKAAATTIHIDGKPIKIAGIAKGSGMIAPDMATMLVYLFTDAAVDLVPLQTLLSRQTDTTFNAITVDSDTSTSDTLLLAATGKADATRITDANSKTAKESTTINQ